MNKLTKLMLASAVLATSGFASDIIADLQGGGVIEAGGAINMQGQTLNLATGKTLDVYGTISGNGTIKCGESAQVVVHESEFVKDTSNADAIKNAAGKLLGTDEIAKINEIHVLKELDGEIAVAVEVEPAEALEKKIGDLATYVGDKTAADLIYIANSGGAEMKFVGEESTPAVTACAFANADASIDGLTPAGLIIENKCEFSGNNSAFTGKTVKIGSESAGAEVVISAANALFGTVIEVAKGSKLDITATGGVELSKNMTINSSEKVLAADPNFVFEKSIGKLDVTGKLVIKNGVTLTLGSEGGVEQVIADHTTKYPQVMSWPVGTFNNTLIDSDGSTFATGTKNDGVFSYTVDNPEAPSVYKRTHDAYLGTSVPDAATVNNSFFESDETDKSGIVLRLFIYGKSSSGHREMCAQFFKKPTVGTNLSYSDLIIDMGFDPDTPNTLYTYEGNDTIGYYWKPTNLESCPANMKTTYEDIVNGTWYKSTTGWVEP